MSKHAHQIAERPATLGAMRSSIRRPGRAATVAAIAILAAACDPSGSGDESIEVVPGVPSGTVAVPPERLTPFCQAMIDLSERLETDPPQDIEAFIIDEYTRISDEVPAEISVEFNAVLAQLRGEPVPIDAIDVSTTTTSAATATSRTGTPTGANTEPDGSSGPEGDEFFEEGYLPGDDPAERLNAYVDFACRDSQNNPGPPATQPLDEIAPTTEPS